MPVSGPVSVPVSLPVSLPVSDLMSDPVSVIDALCEHNGAHKYYDKGGGSKKPHSPW